jgi:hypothetical protein
MGFRKDYAIGETIRSLSHMIIEPTAKQAIQAVNSLNEHDFAFVRRSDRSFSYSIVAYRSTEPDNRVKNNTETVEECMTFVMDSGGSTKMVRKRFWSDFVRLVHVQRLGKHRFTKHSAFISRKKNPPSICEEVEAETCEEAEAETKDNLGTPLNGIIAFGFHECEDECSLLSSVSDRARERKKSSVMM